MLDSQFQNVIQLNAAFAQSYNKYLAYLVSEISMKALEPDLFEHSVQTKRLSELGRIKK